MMMSVASLGIVGLTWALLAYSLAFGRGTGAIGGLEFLGLENVGLEVKGSIPHLLFMAYQATFAIITAALISGAIVERMRFGPYLAFIALWTIVVYAPAAHWVWGGGWLGSLGVLDYAGGTVVHVNAASAALAAALVLRPRRDYGRQALLPHNVPYVLLGAALLWFGWFGFNAGSALGANKAAALAFVNTFLAPAATLVVWMLIELARTGRATAVGVATGIVVGLVAITPAAGFVSPLGAIAIGGDRGAAQLLRDSLAKPHGARRLARRGRRAWRWRRHWRTAHRRVRAARVGRVGRADRREPSPGRRAAHRPGRRGGVQRPRDAVAHQARERDCPGTQQSAR